MTRGTDIEIARLAGSLRPVRDDGPEATLMVGQVPPYSADLNAIVDLIRYRWPDAVAELSPFAAFLWNDWAAANAGSFAGAPLGEGSGASDAERLANAVLVALRREQGALW